MEIETKFERLQEVWFLKDNEIFKDKIIGIEIVYGKRNSIVTPFVKITYHFNENYFNGGTFGIVQKDCFSNKEELLKSLKMKRLFRSEQKTPKHISNKVPKDIIHKEFILNFFSELPIENLKELINFKEIDFENKDLWNDRNKQEMLSQLTHENVVKYTCEIFL